MIIYPIVTSQADSQKNYAILVFYVLSTIPLQRSRLYGQGIGSSYWSESFSQINRRGLIG